MSEGSEAGPKSRHVGKRDGLPWDGTWGPTEVRPTGRLHRGFSAGRHTGTAAPAGAMLHDDTRDLPHVPSVTRTLIWTLPSTRPALPLGSRAKKVDLTHPDPFRTTPACPARDEWTEGLFLEDAPRPPGEWVSQHVRVGIEHGGHEQVQTPPLTPSPSCDSSGSNDPSTGVPPTSDVPLLTPWGR